MSSFIESYMSTLQQYKESYKNKGFNFVPLTREHTSLYYEWFNNPVVRRNLLPTTPKSEEKIKEWIEDITTCPNTKYFIIYESEMPIGHFGIKDMKLTSNTTKTAELSCVIGREESIGTGDGMRAMASFFKYAFDNYSFDEVYITRLKGISGQNFFTRLGFEFSDDDDTVVRYTLSRHKYLALMGGES